MNRKYILLVTLVACLATLYNSCKEPEPTGPSAVTTATLTGTVRDVRSPVGDATVNLAQPAKNINENRTTDSIGTFSFTVDLRDTFTTSATLTITKTGYLQKIQTVSLQPGRTNSLGNITIQDTTTTTATLTGTVRDVQSPVAGVSVNLAQPVKNINVNQTTANDGSFSFTVNLRDTLTADATLTITKSGYLQKIQTVSLQPGRTNPLGNITIQRDTTTGVGGGTYANTIALIGISTTQLAVYGVGGTETAIITYEARDSLGFPIDINHSDTVRFTLNPPGFGGAYISPTSAATNAAGRVAVTINSGTVSGTVQVVAEMNRRGGDIIQSEPVRIVIHAGLPDQRYFTIGAQKFNFAAYDWIGRTNTVTAQAGDRYSNPVQPNTAIYFNTTGGIIQAAGFTNTTGQTTVTIFSGNPLPRDSTLQPPSLFGDGTGYAWIYANTIGQGGTPVRDSLIMLFSGRAEVRYRVLSSTDTTQICFTRGSSQNVLVNIADRFGNPLASGTTVSSTIDVVADSNVIVKTRGEPTQTFDDFIHRGPGRTDFNISVYDGTIGGATSNAIFTLRISVSGPNGSAFVDIPGRIRLPSDPPCP